jgi:hypothetical protein
MNTIRVIKRGNDWHASFLGKPETWEAGKTHAEAIGNLVLSHTETFGVEIWFPANSVQKLTAEEDTPK